MLEQYIADIQAQQRRTIGTTQCLGVTLRLLWLFYVCPAKKQHVRACHMHVAEASRSIRARMFASCVPQHSCIHDSNNSEHCRVQPNQLPLPNLKIHGGWFAPTASACAYAPLGRPEGGVGNRRERHHRYKRGVVLVVAEGQNIAQRLCASRVLNGWAEG